MSKRLEMLEKLIDRGTSDPFVRYARALELRSLGRLEETLAAFDEVRELHPDYVPTFLMAGQVAIELDRHDEARAWLQQGLRVAEAQGDEHARSELQQALDTLD
ncbi:MAG: tetratricopeptide repeat protein [Myxococcales bacterium]|jgi:tetratricopeptide (TPR) repeat protein